MNTKRATEIKEEKRISLENRLKKLICGRPGEDFRVASISRNKSIFLAYLRHF